MMTQIQQVREDAKRRAQQEPKHEPRPATKLSIKTAWLIGYSNTRLDDEHDPPRDWHRVEKQAFFDGRQSALKKLICNCTLCKAHNPWTHPIGTLDKCTRQMLAEFLAGVRIPGLDPDPSE